MYIKTYIPMVCMVLCLLLLLSGCGVDTPNPTLTTAPDAVTMGTGPTQQTVTTPPTTVPPTTVLPTTTSPTTVPRETEPTIAPTTAPPTTVPPVTEPPTPVTLPPVNPEGLLEEVVTAAGSCWKPLEAGGGYNTKPSPSQLAGDATYEEQLVFYSHLLCSWYSRFTTQTYANTKEDRKSVV